MQTSFTRSRPGEVIVILDTCEAGAVSPLFIDENPHDDERRPESVITSSRAGQFANFTADHSIALYSQQLAAAVATSTGTLRQALDAAAANTAEAAIPICDAGRDALLKLGFDPLACRQTPSMHDPQQLLTRISLGKAQGNAPEGRGN